MEDTRGAPVCRVRLGGDSPRFSQITAGFALLHARGLVRVRYEGVAPFPAGQYPHGFIVQAAFEGGPLLAYDLAEGYAQFPGKAEFDRQLARVDRCYKRGYDRDYHNEMKNRRKLRPLGLPLAVTCGNNFYDGGARLTAEDYMSHNSYPAYKVHFCTRLFDPAQCPEALQDEAARLNTLRIECLRACRAAFGDRFYGGLLPGPYAARRAPELVLPAEDEAAGLRRLRENYICAATQEPWGGFGEEVARFAAAGRAVAATQPRCVLPGEFARGKNFVAFDTPENCVAQLRGALQNVPWIHRMEAANFTYYRQHVRPDAMVLHTLKDAGVLA